jgi:hypothetical protein
MNVREKHEHKNGIDSSWSLCSIKEMNEHCDCPIKKNGSLGNWINRQRKLFRSKKLKADSYEKLVGIVFAFEDVKYQE